MVRSRLGLKALGLCALVFGLMAFAASAAQAEVGAKWGILKANGELVTIAPTSEGGIGDTLLPTFSAEVDVIPVLLTEVSKKKVEIACTGITLENTKLSLAGGFSEGKATLTGCTLKFGGVLQGACKPHTKGAAEGTIQTQAFHGLLRLHSGTLATLILPTTGINGTFANLVLGKEGIENECLCGESISINGSISIQDCNGLFTQHQVKHLFTEFQALTDLWILNKTAEHKATADGGIFVFLTGEHEGLKYAGLA